VFLEYSFEESLSGLGISPLLEKYINNFTILIYCSPQIMLLSINLDEYLIDKKCISLSLVLTFQSGGILRSKLITP